MKGRQKKIFLPSNSLTATISPNRAFHEHIFDLDLRTISVETHKTETSQHKDSLRVHNDGTERDSLNTLLLILFPARFLSQTFDKLEIGTVLDSVLGYQLIIVTQDLGPVLEVIGAPDVSPGDFRLAALTLLSQAERSLDGPLQVANAGP